MGGVISSLFGGGTDKALRNQINAQEQGQQSDQGRQLAAISKQQAQGDNEAAGLAKQGLGRALLQFQQKTAGPAATLGGS